MDHGPVSRRRYSRRVVRQAIIIGVLAITALAILAGAWYVYDSRQEYAVEADTRNLNEEARTQAEIIARAIAGAGSRLTAYASDERIRSLFATGDDAAIAAEAEAALSTFPHALRVRLLHPGRFDVDTTTSPPLSYASIDILNKLAGSTGAVAAEALLMGSPDEHIVMVERVKDASDRLTGIVHLSLDTSLIDEAMTGLSNLQGYVEVQQSGAGNQIVLGQAGDAGLRNGDPTSASIAGTRWTLQYWGAGSTPGVAAESAMSLPWPIIIGVVLILVVIAGLWRLRSPRSNAVPTDKSEISYEGAIKAIMQGAHPGMEKLIKHMPGGKEVPVTFTPGISTGLSGSDDITMIMRKEDLKAQAAQAMAAGDMLDLTAASETPVAAEDPTPTPADESQDTGELPAVIFRKYDIRGVVGKSLTPAIVEKIGLAVGSMAAEAGVKKMTVGRDGRHSSPELAQSLIKGLNATGIEVVDIGLVPTPVLYFSTFHLHTGSGVMITGSHNGPEYNGLKIVLGGTTLSEEGIQAIHDRIVAGNFANGSGSVSTAEIIPDYVRRITDEIPVAFGHALKLVVDCGNGAAGAVAPQLYRALGHDVIDLYCEVDGRFPNHHPDPSQPENLEALIAKVREEQADLGLAFDGDGDRLGVVDREGNVLWPDRQMMVFARDVLSRNPGAEIIFDVKCSSHLKKIIEASGGKPLMWKTGHSLIKGKMKEVHAPLAGEMSGHIFFGERWYGFDDALYSGARLLEILVNVRQDPAEFFAALPGGVATPELRIDMPESRHAGFMDKLAAQIDFPDAEVITVDGFRVEFPNGWGLIRPSNTTPCLIIRFEADDEQALAAIKERFRTLLTAIDTSLGLPF